MLKGCCGLESSFGAQKLLRTASPHRLEAAFVLKDRGLLARTAWKQLWCSKAAAGCQLAPFGSSFLGSFGAQRPLQAAASPHCLQATLVLQSRCGLPARTACKQPWCSKATACRLPWCSKAAAGCQPAPLRTAWKQLWCSKAAANCQPALLGSSFGAQTLRATAARLGSSFGAQNAAAARYPLTAQRPLRAASCRLLARTAAHRLEEALVLKDRCGLPARTA